MHIGKTLLTHLRNCKKCKKRVRMTLDNPPLSVDAAIRYADKVTKDEQVAE